MCYKMKYLTKITFYLALFLLISCKTNYEEKYLQPKIVRYAVIYQTGYSTWYGPGFDGKLTATGEVYDMYDYTAAHRTLPLNTLIRVQNVHNGRWVVVRVNDRGPVRKSLVLDLSKLAAIELQMTDKGSAKVRIQILSQSKNPLGRLVEVCENLDTQLKN